MAEARKTTTRPQRPAKADAATRKKKFDPDEGKALVWPDLVYSELIAMIVVLIILSGASLIFNAPPEEPAVGARGGQRLGQHPRGEAREGHVEGHRRAPGRPPLGPRSRAGRPGPSGSTGARSEALGDAGTHGGPR